MKKLHIALSTTNLDASIKEYTDRLGAAPVAVVKNEYALWRTDVLNLSVRCSPSCTPGALRHLGWEDADAASFEAETDCNGILWEHFSAQQQAEEISARWPESDYQP